jgi:hypothetical protein
MSNWTENDENERLVGLVVLHPSTPRSFVLLTGARKGALEPRGSYGA